MNHKNLISSILLLINFALFYFLLTLPDTKNEYWGQVLIKA